jgi:serine/threonine protein kinase
MTEFGGWEQIELLGEGGQSEVWKVRSPSRVQKRRDAIKEASQSNPWEHSYAGMDALTASEPMERIERFARSIWDYVRPDDPSELGALKKYKIPEKEPEATRAVGRLKHEIEVLQQNRPGLVKLLEKNEQEKWIITEFMPGGTVETNIARFRGDAFSALKAFRSIVETAAGLHKDERVHRDIKPANVFIGENGQLVLGDLGIVFLPESTRQTASHERVGARDYMPPWGYTGMRLEEVQPNFDVYMLGKLLWCMIAGRLFLPREDHREADYDLEKLFPNSRHMKNVNAILDKCLVPKADRCLASAKELLEIVDYTLGLFERGLPLLDQSGALRCHVCGDTLVPNSFFRSKILTQV